MCSTAGCFTADYYRVVYNVKMGASRYAVSSRENSERTTTYVMRRGAKTGGTTPSWDIRDQKHVHDQLLQFTVRREIDLLLRHRFERRIR